MTSEFAGIPHKIACFYYRQPVNLQTALRVGLDCFALIGLQPNRMATTGDKKVKVFSRSRKKIEADNGQHVDMFDFYAIPDHLGGDPWNGFLGMFRVNNYLGYSYGITDQAHATFSIRASLLSDVVFDDICFRVASLLRPSYGFRDVFPACGIGLVSGGLEFHSDGDKFYQAGFIEAIKPWNIVNSTHLQRRVGNVCFADWVAADPARGALKPYVEGCWLWQIDRNRLGEVEQTLLDADILFDRMKHYYPWVHPFGGRIARGDLSRKELIGMLVAHVQKTGLFPKPAPRWEMDPMSQLWLADEVAVTQWLKEWGHPAANLPEPPPPKCALNSERRAT